MESYILSKHVHEVNYPPVILSICFGKFHGRKEWLYIRISYTRYNQIYGAAFAIVILSLERRGIQGFRLFVGERWCTASSVTMKTEGKSSWSFCGLFNLPAKPCDTSEVYNFPVVSVLWYTHFSSNFLLSRNTLNCNWNRRLNAACPFTKRY